MAGLINTLVISFLFVSIPVLLMPQFLADDASAQQCGIQICKSAEVEEPELFPLVFMIEGKPPSHFDLVPLENGGECDTFLFVPAVPADIFEEDVPGWVLKDVECDTAGIDVSFIERGVHLECVGPNEGTGTCTFVNVRSERPIPTLSEWGMIAAAGGLGLVGVFFAIRKRKARAV